MSGEQAHMMGGRYVLVPPEDAARTAAAFRLAARAARADGIDYRTRAGAGDYARLLALYETAAAADSAGNGNGIGRTVRVVAPSGELVTTAEAARILGIKPRAVLARIARGELPARRAGHQWLIRREDVRPITHGTGAARCPTV